MAKSPIHALENSQIYRIAEKEKRAGKGDNKTVTKQNLGDISLVHHNILWSQIKGQGNIPTNH